MSQPDPDSDQLAIFRDCLESHGDAIAVLDENGVFVFGNSRYNEMFFDPADHPKVGESAIEVVRRIVDGDRVFGVDQMDPDHAVLNMVIDCFSFVQGAEFGLKDGRVIQVSSTPTNDGRIMMTFRDTRRDRLGERRAVELLSDGFGSADMGMILWDAGLVVQLVNPAWQDLTLPGQIGDDISSHFTRFVEQGMLKLPDGQSIESFVHDTIKSIHAEPMRFVLHLSDGRHVQLSTFGILSGGVMATAMDISVQFDAEERARVLLQDAVEALDFGVLHFDANLELLMMNRAAKNMIMANIQTPELGTRLSEIAESLIDNGAVPIPDGKSREDLVALFEHNARTYKSRHRVAWDNNRTYEFSTHPTEMGGYLVSIQDLTEAVHAGRKAREAHDLVTTIVDASPTTFLVSKVETGEVVYATQASRERFGDIKSTLSFFLDPEHRKSYLAALLPTGSLTDYPVRFRRQDGSIMDGLTSARVIEYQGEKMIVSSTRDITDFLAMQRELEIQRRTALQNEKLSALGELLAGVAHELSNPLSVVVGYSMMLRDEIDDQAYLHKVDRIAIAADRCVRIVKMFLALAREKPATLEMCAMADLLEDAIAVSCGSLEAVGGTLVSDVDIDLPHVLADPDHITQVFSNLLTNASHSVRDLGSDGQISIRAYRAETDRQVVVEVQDNGPGVPPDIQHRIFEPFFTTKDVGKGTGVGLAFSHRVVTAHGGTLSLDSPRDGGALFRVCLPTGSSASEVENPATPAMPGVDSGTPIMVLDDDPSVSEVLRDVLTRAGYSVDVFDNGQSALAHCRLRPYAVIMCDMRMPDIDGEQFFQKLAQLNSDMAKRVVFLTGDTMNPAVCAFLSQCGQPCLEKPIMPAELLEVVSARAVWEGA